MSGVVLESVSFAWNQGTDQEVQVLSDLSLTIQEQALVCLLAPSGAGKSTMLYLMSGLELPTAGRVLWRDEPVTGPSPDRGLVFQAPTLFPWADVQANVEWGLRMQGVPRRRRRAQAEQMLRNVGLAAWAHHRVDELSGGMRQRAAMARALANGGSLLLLDEPFVGLDVQTRMLMQRFTLRLWSEEGKTVVLVTHDINEALMADRVVVLSRRPARILDDVEVTLPRPRDMQDRALTTLRTHLSRLIEAEVMAGAREEGTWEDAARAPAVWRTNGDGATEKAGGMDSSPVTKKMS